MSKTNKIPLKQGQAVTVGLFIRDIDTNDLIDLSNFTARMQIRQTQDDATARDLLETDDLTANNGRIVLGDGIEILPVGGSETFNVLLTWTAAEAAALKLNEGLGLQDTYQGLGDLELKDFSGEITISIRIVFAQTREVTLV